MGQQESTAFTLFDQYSKKISHRARNQILQYYSDQNDLSKPEENQNQNDQNDQVENEQNDQVENEDNEENEVNAVKLGLSCLTKNVVSDFITIGLYVLLFLTDLIVF